MSGRSKAIIAIDLIVLAALAIVGGAFVLTSQRDSSTNESATAPTTSQPATSPFRSPDGLAWIMAACGAPMLVDDMPNSPLPRAIHWATCLGTPPFLIGIYDNRSDLDGDVERQSGLHRYATRTDDSGRIWMFLIEGQDAAPLNSLKRYGFDVR